MHAACIGIDFGTTNSAVALADRSGAIQVARFPFAGGLTDVYRSLLYFEQQKRSGAATSLTSLTGPAAIERYLAAETKGRLIQSLKSFLSNRSLEATDIFGRRHTLQDLIARILRDLRHQAEAQFGRAITAAVVGRPVQFVGAGSEADNAYAERRLLDALRLAGFETVHVELEPVAAAHFYQSTLDHDELILIGDFGGGTSDFSLMRVGPTTGARDASQQLLGNAGVGVAGDAFDARIIQKLVSPVLGAGTQMRSWNKTLPVPIGVYANLERWHYLSLLRNSQVLSKLETVRAHAFEPKKIRALIDLIKGDMGYQLHRSVQKLKCELSERDTGLFEFREGDVDIQAPVERTQFEAWIRSELEQVEACVDELLVTTGVAASDVDRVFLTGGTSFVPAVRRIFESRFGADRLRTGNEFTSVVRGLSLKAGDVS